MEYFSTYYTGNQYTGLTKHTSKFSNAQLNSIKERSKIVALPLDKFEYWAGYFKKDISKSFREFDIPKRKEGYRHIKAPVGAYKTAQAKAMRVLKYDLKILEHEAAYGFVKNRSCLDAAKLHQANNSRFFVKIDLSNFFPSITVDTLKEQLEKLYGWKRYVPNSIKSDLLWLFTDENGRLGQGMISSPYLANLVMVEFDYYLSGYCKSKGLVYTRYADDMIFSSTDPIDMEDLLKYIKYRLPKGTLINPDKISYKTNCGQNFLLGIMYNKDFNLTAGWRRKNQMKVIAHKIEQGEIPAEDIPHWRGVYSYCLSIDPVYFSQERFKVLRRNNG